MRIGALEKVDMEEGKGYYLCDGVTSTPDLAGRVPRCSSSSSLVAWRRVIKHWVCLKPCLSGLILRNRTNLLRIFDRFLGMRGPADPRSAKNHVFSQPLGSDSRISSAPLVPS